MPQCIYARVKLCYNIYTFMTGQQEREIIEALLKERGIGDGERLKFFSPSLGDLCPLENYKGLAYSYRNMARLFDVEGRKDSAEVYYRKAYHVMKEKSEPRWAYGILSELSSFYSNWGKPDSATVLAKAVLSRYAYPVAQLVLAETYYRQQAFDSAQVYCRKVLATGDLYHRCDASLLLAAVAILRRSFKPSIYTRDVSFTKFINSLDTGGITLFNTCGNIILLYIVNLSNPNTFAASN